MIRQLHVVILIAVGIRAGPATGQALDRAQILRAVGDELLNSSPVSSQEFIQSLGADAGLEEEAVRAALLAELDTLEGHRKKKDPVWEGIQAAGGDKVTPKQIGKMVKELIKKARKTVKKSRDVPIEDLLKAGARKADLADYRARSAVLSALGIDTDSSDVYLGFPPKVVLLFERGTRTAWVSSSGLNLGRGYDAQRITSPESMAAIRRDLESYVQRELNNSSEVHWISTRRTKGLEPNGRLIFSIVESGYALDAS